MKVLIVDDDLVLADVVAFTLRRAGFEIALAHDGQVALERWRGDQPDLVILDLNLPRLDGLSVCRQIRAEATTPIIILSVRGDDEDVVHGLELGADDYLTKPFSPSQLVARAQAVLRRSGMQFVPNRLSAGDLSLDPTRREVMRLGHPAIQLTRLEYRLLEVLVINSGQVVPAETLIDKIWGPSGGDRAMLKQLVHRLRSKIEDGSAQPSYLETVPGIGYALVSRSGE